MPAKLLLPGLLLFSVPAAPSPPAERPPVTTGGAVKADTGSQSTAGKGKNAALTAFASDADMKEVAEVLVRIKGSQSLAHKRGGLVESRLTSC